MSEYMCRDTRGGKTQALHSCSGSAGVPLGLPGRDLWAWPARSSCGSGSSGPALLCPRPGSCVSLLPSLQLICKVAMTGRLGPSPGWRAGVVETSCWFGQRPAALPATSWGRVTQEAPRDGAVGCIAEQGEACRGEAGLHSECFSPSLPTDLLERWPQRQRQKPRRTPTR